MNIGQFSVVEEQVRGNVQGKGSVRVFLFQGRTFTVIGVEKFLNTGDLRIAFSESILWYVRSGNLMGYTLSRIRPSLEIVTTFHGRNLPLTCSAFFTAFSIPPQQGTSIRTTVTLRMGLCFKISVSFSE